MWLDNLIFSLWDWALGVWSNGLNSVEDLLTMSPSEFAGGTVWNAVVSIHNSLQGAGYALLVLFFLFGMIHTTTNFAEIKRPEVAILALVRLCIVKGLVESGMVLINYLIGLGQDIVSIVFRAGGFFPAASTLPDDIRAGIADCPFMEKLMLFLVSLLAILAIVVLTFVVILSVFGRFFKIYLHAALGPIPLAAFGGEPTQSIGIGYLKSLGVACLEGATVAVACVLYSALSVSIPGINPDATLIVQLTQYIVSVIFHSLLLSSLVKGSELVTKQILGLF